MLFSSKLCKITVEIQETIDTAVALYASKYNLSKEHAYQELLVFALQQNKITDLTEVLG